MGTVTTELDAGIATLTFSRPPVNATDYGALLDIRDAFRALDDQRDVKVAIFTAAGERAFMAGVDLKSGDAPADPDDRPATLLVDPGRAWREAMWAITDCAVPVIAAVNGPAIGGGLAFAAVCDMIVAAEESSFGTTEINVGLLGASAHLSLLLGRHLARELFFTGRMVSAAELHRLGAINRCVPRAELMTAARELAGELAGKSPIALRLAKESMNRVEFMPLKEAYRQEQDYTQRLLTYRDAGEAKEANAHKRPPEWSWR